MRLIAELPHDKGSYALLLHLDQAVTRHIGRLGEIKFEAGDYVYTGSALGPGGLHGRIQHHLRISSSFHWHIDYLMSSTRLESVLYTLAPVSKECDWVTELQRMPCAALVVKGFGSSDCHSKCLSHLIHFKSPVTTRMVWTHLSASSDRNSIMCDYVDPSF